MIARDRIVIGASAGGVTALQQVVAGLPADLPAAVFITLHMYERNQAMLPDLLSPAGPLRASLAVDGERIENGRIYVAPFDYDLLFTPETLHLGHGPKEGLQRPSINVMFRSAAAVFGERTAGWFSQACWMTALRDCGRSSNAVGSRSCKNLKKLRTGRCRRAPSAA